MEHKEWCKFYSLLSGYKKTYIILYFTKLANICLNILMPAILSLFIDEVLYHHNTSSALSLIILYCLLFLMFAIFSACDIVIWQYLSNYLVVSVKKTLWEKVLSLKMIAFEHYQYADIVTLINEDSRVFVRLINQNIFPFINAVTTFIFCLVAIFYYNANIGLFVMFVIPGIALINKYWGRKLEKIAVECRDTEVNITSQLLEVIKSLIDIKLLAAENFFLEKLSQNINKYLIVSNKLTIGNSKTTNKVSFINSLCKLSVMMIAGLAVFSGKMTIGIYVAIITYMHYVYDATMIIVNFNFQIHQRKNNLLKIFEMLNEHEEKIEIGERLKVTQGNIIFSNVSFSYKENGSTLRNLSFEVTKGEILGLIGSNGSGKSTIISLLTRIYSPKKGKIYIDNQDIENVSIRSLRNSLAVFTQNEFIDSNITIEDYIKLNHICTTEQTIFQSLNQYNFCDFLTEEDVKRRKMKSLSGGQIQRIRLALILMSGAPILIFDEPTSVLNVELEEMFFSYIMSLKTKKTIIIISHGEQYQKYFDTILELD